MIQYAKKVRRIGITVAIVMILFPPWDCWQKGQGWCGTGTHYTAYAILVHHPYAAENIDTETLLLQLGLVALLTCLGANACTDREKVRHWRQKWDYAHSNPDTLLRSSDVAAVCSGDSHNRTTGVTTHRPVKE
jgi:hypothetical protein